MSRILRIYISICKSVLKYDLKYWRDRKVTGRRMKCLPEFRTLRSTVSVISTHPTGSWEAESGKYTSVDERDPVLSKVEGEG